MNTKTHDYTQRYWGHDYTITTIIDGGLRIKAMGWGTGIKPDDFLILQNQNKTTRYRVQTIEYFSDPQDMWTATLEFAPRQTVAAT